MLGLPIHDNWRQTETGGIMIANTPAFDIRPGSMGWPLPGVEACLVRKREDGSRKIVDEPGVEGELALGRGWPSMFRGYLSQDERYRRSFVGDLHLSGDSAGHLIGPFEVESALMGHPAVAEAGVIRKPGKLGAAVAPKELEFRAVLPRTRSGKIMRRLLKARELGLPEDDPSTLEAGS